jgi:peroxiredoxin
MSRILTLSFAAVLLVGLAANQESPGPAVGSEAPDFELADSAGKTYKLSDFRGQKVVLEIIRSGGW